MNVELPTALLPRAWMGEGLRLIGAKLETQQDLPYVDVTDTWYLCVCVCVCVRVRANAII